jgi:hypothetical protein
VGQAISVACQTRKETTVKLSALFLAFSALSFAQSLDFEAYRTKVEPIFLKKREGHSRCISCHAANHSIFNLQPLSEGATKFTAAQYKKNFDNVKTLVVPGNPDKSRLLLHPLAHDAGGDEFHSGGRQFTTKDDPDWKIIYNWVRAGK